MASYPAPRTIAAGGPSLCASGTKTVGLLGRRALQALWRSSGSPLGGREDRVSLILAALLTHRVRFCSGALVHDVSKLNLKLVVTVDLQE